METPVKRRLPRVEAPRKAPRTEKQDVHVRRLDFSALHELLHYGGDVTPAQRKIFEFVQRNCEIPLDFEANHKYGPKSGITHEERVIAAFVHGLFPVDKRLPRKQLKRLVAARKWDEAALVCK